jgi:hypothetical protein
MTYNNTDIVYKKQFDKRTYVTLVKNDGQLQMVVFIKVNGNLIPQATERTFEIWERNSAIEEIEDYYIAFKKAEKQVQDEIKKQNDVSLPALQRNMKEMSETALKNIVRSN